MTNLGTLQHQAGDTDTARTWYQHAADAGHTNAMTALGILHAEAGDTDTARTCWTLAATSGSAEAADLLAGLAEE
jgi:TPR repeat protein